MLSMNVVTANAASASGAELPHSSGLAAAAGVAPLCSCVDAIRRSWTVVAIVLSSDRWFEGEGPRRGDVTCKRRRALCARRVGVESLPPRHWTLSAIVDPARERAIGVHTDHERGTPQHVAALPQRHPSQRHTEPAGRPISPPAPWKADPQTPAERPCTRAHRTPSRLVSRSRTQPSRILLELVRLRGSGRYRVAARRSPSSRVTVSTSTTSSAVVRKLVKHTRR